MQAATLSIDLDDYWAYRRSFGYSDWQAYPSFLSVAIPRFLALQAELRFDATAFIIGHDASLGQNRTVFATIGESALEVGNHSFWHEHGLQYSDRETISNELVDAEQAIFEATGKRPVGFRGPAFATSPNLLHCLIERGYLYDASAFPTSIGPLARLYQRRTSRSTHDVDDKQNDNMYGGFREAFGSLKPFYWCLAEHRLLEIPVTTMPLTRLPIHMTYVHYLAEKSIGLARSYFKLALSLCRWFRITPSFLLHATDFIGADDSFELAFLPGMGRAADDKVALVRELLGQYQRSFNVIGLATFAKLQDPAALESRQIQVAPGF